MDVNLFSQQENVCVSQTQRGEAIERIVTDEPTVRNGQKSLRPATIHMTPYLVHKMQEFRSMPGGGGAAARIFGGDRRLRPFPNQALKCPRCESLNTKFCYYNNYNLSQPRHFCKSCRRYWTKGGVLRNVPVGGGCRKAKRSKPKPSPDTERKSTASHSSSESSSLTNTANDDNNNNKNNNHNHTTEAASSSAGVHNSHIFHDSRFLFNGCFEQGSDGDGGGGMFTETATFTSLMTNPSSFLGYNFDQITPFRLQQQEQQQQVQLQQQKMLVEDEEQMKIEELTAAAVAASGCFDQTVPVDFQNRTSTGELSALEWNSGDGGDQGLFDLPNTNVDQGGYWGQSQWTDNDHHLYLPP